jgi:hypothetical protein
MLLRSKYLASSRLGSKVFGLQGHNFGIIKFGIKPWLGCWMFFFKIPNSLSDKCNYRNKYDGSTLINIVLIFYFGHCVFVEDTHITPKELF